MTGVIGHLLGYPGVLGCPKRRQSESDPARDRCAAEATAMGRGCGAVWTFTVPSGPILGHDHGG